MTPSAILESALYVTDLAVAEAFYAGILGLQRIAKAEGRHVFFRCGQGVLLLFNAEATSVAPSPDASLPVPPHGAAGQGHLCFAASADEIVRWKAALQQKGIAIEADFEWPNGGRSIYFRDPSGNSLEFAEPRIWRL
jgi:catechol 2,3-dioxygenase-like lactoylglutathione lyase family enzyme